MRYEKNTKNHTIMIGKSFNAGPTNRHAHIAENHIRIRGEALISPRTFDEIIAVEFPIFAKLHFAFPRSLRERSSRGKRCPAAGYKKPGKRAKSGRTLRSVFISAETFPGRISR